MKKNLKFSQETTDAIVKLLVDMGLSKKAAKTLTYLSQMGESGSIQLEEVTTLKQPEVSMAIKELCDRDWIEKSKINKEGKGRPLDIYKASISLDKAVNVLIDQKKNEIKKIQTDIKRLEFLTHQKIQ